MAEYINREELLKDVEDSVRFSTRNRVSAELRGAHKIVDCIRSAPACDVVEVDVIKEWLCKIAINNVGCVIDGDFSNACEEIISRLDGLRAFARERWSE